MLSMKERYPVEVYRVEGKRESKTGTKKSIYAIVIAIAIAIPTPFTLIIVQINGESTYPECKQTPEIDLYNRAISDIRLGLLCGQHPWSIYKFIMILYKTFSNIFSQIHKQRSKENKNVQTNHRIRRSRSHGLRHGHPSRP